MTQRPKAFFAKLKKFLFSIQYVLSTDTQDQLFYCDHNMVHLTYLVSISGLKAACCTAEESCMCGIAGDDKNIVGTDQHPSH